MKEIAVTIVLLAFVHFVVGIQIWTALREIRQSIDDHQEIV